MELVAAFVGAFVAFAFGEWAVRVRHRRRDVESATLLLISELPEVTYAYTQDGASKTDTSTGGYWWQKRNRAFGALVTIRVSARWPMRRARKIKRQADRLSARFGAAELRAYQENWLDLNELLDVTTSELTPTVFGDQDNLDELTNWYLEHGFQGSPPKPSGVPLVRWGRPLN